MLELTPPLEHGSDRLAVHIIEPGGALWLSRMDHRRFRILLIPPGQRSRLAQLMAKHPVNLPLPLFRRDSLGNPQQLTISATDRTRLDRALLELERFEAHPDLPEWRERGYHTPTELETLMGQHPEWFELEGDSQ
jgi:hypothetical protein